MPKPNTLNQFSSYNAIFSLSCLTVDEVAKPDETYRVTEPSMPIIRMGGGVGPNKVTTAYEDTIKGRLEYFIDDITIEGIVVPNTKSRTTNATFLSFSVTEPYSMGLFLQTLHIAATQAGYTNYLAAPFLLQVEFIGYDDDGDILVVEDGRNLKRMFPLKLTSVEFDVNAAGSQYYVEAIPWNEQALLDNVNKAKTDINIKGKNLVELLQTGEQSLTTVINGRYEQLRKQNQNSVADEIVITFPKEISSFSNGVQDTPVDQGATTRSGGGGGVFGKVVGAVVGGIIKGALNGTLDTQIGGLLTAFKEGDFNKLFQGITGFLGAQAPQDFEAFLSMITGQVMTKSPIGEGLARIAQDPASLNGIGAAEIITSFNEMGRSPMPQTGQVYDKKNKVMTRAKNVISPKEREFTFSSGTAITRMIEECLLSSQWGASIKDKAPDENGMVEWFRIECDTFIKPDASQQQQAGEPAKVYNYKVVPYKVHSSTLQKPADPGLSYENLKANAVKEYNYIYTGQNLDIINFDIKINAAFYSGVLADSGQNNLSQKTGGTQQKATTEEDGQLTINEINPSISSTGQITQNDNTSVSTLGGGGSGIDNNKIRTARLFHDLIINSNVDLVQLDMEIHGDPYFIFDSGMGNYTASSSSPNETADGTIDYQRNEIDIIVNFRTPVDYDPDSGVMVFPEDTVPVDAFSGLYRVFALTNYFRGGKFTQKLSLLRRRNQLTDTKQEGTQDDAYKVKDATPQEQAPSPYL